MITKEAQIQTLLKDISRAEKAGLATVMKYPDKYHSGEFLIASATVTSDVFTELLGYLRQSYPDVCFRQIGRYVYYELQ